jgi:redox-sensitive bicupin YhaK (pirin superfamily)
VAEGKVTINGQTLSGGDAAAVEGEAAIEVQATESAQVLLFDLK